AVGGKAVPPRQQVAPKLLIVVNFPVEDDPDRAIFIAHRLMAGREVNDAEPSHPDPGAPIHINAVIVRPAMADPVTHRSDALFVSGLLTQRESGYSAHD